MANRERGELSIRASDGQVYTFALGLNAQCEIEAKIGTPEQPVSYGDFLKRLKTASDIRLLFWAASRRHHKDLTEEEVGAIVDQAYVGIKEIMTAANALIDAGAPTPADEEAAGRPPKAQTKHRSAGVTSTSKPDALA